MSDEKSGLIAGLDKAFDNRIRVGIMAVLLANEWVDFNTLKKLLAVTDGNLATHLTALEQVQYICIRKEFVGRKPRTSYQASPTGRQAFTEHLNAIEMLLKNAKQP